MEDNETLMKIKAYKNVCGKETFHRKCATWLSLNMSLRMFLRNHRATVIEGHNVPEIVQAGDMTREQMWTILWTLLK